MKLFRAPPDQFVFRLSKQERDLLFAVLQMYPLVPPAHHQIAAPATAQPDLEHQQLLDAALADHRREKREQVLALLAAPERVRPKGQGVEFILPCSQVEWLLQVLNDVRVGSWIALGEPEAEARPQITAENARYFMALDVCGLFQSELLRALGVDQSSEWQ